MLGTVRHVAASIRTRKDSCAPLIAVDEEAVDDDDGGGRWTARRPMLQLLRRRRPMRGMTSSSGDFRLIRIAWRGVPVVFDLVVQL